jgi:hypothetical protein
MPPQQAYGLLDFVDDVHNFVAHFAAISPLLKFIGWKHSTQENWPGA